MPQQYHLQQTAHFSLDYSKHISRTDNFDVLLTVHLSIILVINSCFIISLLYEAHKLIMKQGFVH